MSHDLAVVRIVERGPVERVFREPQHSATQALVAASAFASLKSAEH